MALLEKGEIADRLVAAYRDKDPSVSRAQAKEEAL